jgi:hypothetical protein
MKNPVAPGGEARGGGGLGQAMEINEFQKRLTDEALLRGKIIASYSLVEYVLADISVRLDLQFPYRIKDRIKAVKEIVDRPAYEAYRNDFHRVCDELLRYDDLRNFMAQASWFWRPTRTRHPIGSYCNAMSALRRGNPPPHARIFDGGPSRAGKSNAHVFERRLCRL